MPDPEIDIETFLAANVIEFALGDEMASKLSPWGACRSLTIRTRSILQHGQRQTAVPFHIARRGLADNTTSRDPPPGSDGALPPSMAGQSYTPPPPEQFAPNWLNAEAIANLEKVAAGEDLYDEEVGLKFGKLSTLPGKNDHLQKRYPEVIDQVTKLLMRDGKLSKAQRVRIYHYSRATPLGGGTRTRKEHERLTRLLAGHGIDPQLPPHIIGTEGVPSAATPAGCAPGPHAPAGPGTLPHPGH